MYVAPVPLAAFAVVQIRGVAVRKRRHLSLSLTAPLRGLLGHFTPIVVSKKVPATCGYFVYFFQNTPIFELEVCFLSK